MRIDSNNKIDAVHETYINKSRKAQSDEKEELKQDRIELSGSTMDQDDLSALKEAVLNEVEKGTSPHKLRRIQSEIDAGTYSTDAWKAADAMLKP